MKAEEEGMSFSIEKIGFLSDPSKAYTDDLTKAKSLTELQVVGKKWESVASDALMRIREMSQEDFETFRHGLARERRGHFAGEEFSERFANIMMPDILFAASMKAIEFKAPWGLCYIRMRDAGQIYEKNGIALLKLHACAPS